MTTDSAHIIKQQVLEFSIGDQQRAKEMQDTLGNLCHKRITPLLDRVCQKYDQNGKVIRIEKLELDLGKVDFRQLEESLPQLIGNLFEEELSKRVMQLNSQLGMPLYKDEVLVQSAANVEAVRHFLRLGVWPWSQQSPAGDFSEAMEELLHTSPQELSRVLKAELRSQQALYRLVYQTDESLRKKILRLLTPTLAEPLLVLIKVLKSLEKQRTFTGLSYRLFEQLVWQGALAAVVHQVALKDIVPLLITHWHSRKPDRRDAKSRQKLVSALFARLKHKQRQNRAIDSEILIQWHRTISSSETAFLSEASQTDKTGATEVLDETVVQSLDYESFEEEQAFTSEEASSAATFSKEDLSEMEEFEEMSPTSSADGKGSHTHNQEPSKPEALAGDLKSDSKQPVSEHSNPVADDLRENREAERNIRDMPEAKGRQEHAEDDLPISADSETPTASNSESSEKDSASEQREDRQGVLSETSNSKSKESQKVGVESESEKPEMRIDRHEEEKPVAITSSELAETRDHKASPDITISGKEADTARANQLDEVKITKADDEELVSSSPHRQDSKPRTEDNQISEASLEKKAANADAVNQATQPNRPDEIQPDEIPTSDAGIPKDLNSVDLSTGKQQLKESENGAQPQKQNLEEQRQENAAQEAIERQQQLRKQRNEARAVTDQKDNSSANSESRPSPSIPWRLPTKALKEVYINNAGLVLIWPFLSTLFKGMEWIEGPAFVSEEAQHRAACYLQYLVTGDPIFREEEMVLNKLLAGLEAEAAIDTSVVLTETEKEEADHLLGVVIQNWSILKGTSVPGLQKTFFQREGLLKKEFNGWKLFIEHTTLDVLLEKLPWSYAVIKLPWIEDMIYVEW